MTSLLEALRADDTRVACQIAGRLRLADPAGPDARILRIVHTSLAFTPVEEVTADMVAALAEQVARWIAGDRTHPTRPRGFRVLPIWALDGWAP